MTIPMGPIKQRSKHSLTIIAPTGRDPEAGKYRQVWQTIKRHAGETNKQLRGAERELRRPLVRVDEGEGIKGAGSPGIACAYLTSLVNERMAAEDRRRPGNPFG